MFAGLDPDGDDDDDDDPDGDDDHVFSRSDRWLRHGLIWLRQGRPRCRGHLPYCHVKVVGDVLWCFEVVGHFVADQARMVVGLRSDLCNVRYGCLGVWRLQCNGRRGTRAAPLLRLFA